jgi:predicted RNase H-like HicB family nuclease
MRSREEVLAELNGVFEMISEEYRDKRIPRPADTTEIVHA